MTKKAESEIHPGTNPGKTQTLPITNITDHNQNFNPAKLANFALSNKNLQNGEKIFNKSSEIEALKVGENRNKKNENQNFNNQFYANVLKRR